MVRHTRLIAAAAAVVITGALLVAAGAIGKYGEILFAIGLDHYQRWWGLLVWTIWISIVSRFMFKARRRASEPAQSGIRLPHQTRSTPL